MGKINENEIEMFYQMYISGKTCEQIGICTKHKTETISKYLKKYYGIIPRKKVDVDLLRELVKSGKTTKECAEFFNVNLSAISRWKRQINDDVLNIVKPFSKEHHELSKIQKQMILGSLLGDLNISKPKKHHETCKLSIVHSLKQKELFLKKVEILNEFMGNYKEYSYVDKRTNNTYYTIRGNTKSHKVFNEIYNILYIDGVKTITYKYLDMIDHPIALAYWFMDDGTNRGQIATHCFSLNEVNILSDWLKNKFDINTTIQKQLNNYVLYITAYSREKFDKLIYPYVVPSMRYKLKFSELEESVNPVNSGEAR